MTDETIPAQILEENQPENLVGQATFIPESILETKPIEPILSEEIKISEPIPVPIIESTPIQEIPQPEITPPNPLSAQMNRSDGLQQERGSEPIPHSQISTDPINSNITIERTPDTVTITEIMQPIVSRTVLDTKSFLKSLLPKLKEKLFSRTEKRLSKIMGLARKIGEIQNDDVEKLLHVSDASATNYLSKLVQRGSLRVSGPKNHTKYLPN